MAGTNVVVVDRGNNTTCTINLLGATIISWRVKNVEQLCVSNTTRFDQQTEITGGIQIIFPHYGNWKFGPKHGFARLVRWNIEKGPEKIASGDMEVIFSLKETEYTKAMWNFPFAITYRLILREKELRLYVKITNTGKMKIKYDFLLLNYLKVPNIEDTQIIGLFRSHFFDKLSKKCIKCHYLETHKFLTLDKEIDRVYCSNTYEIILADPSGKEYMEVWKENMINVLIWKPGKKKTDECSNSNNDGEFNEDDYLTMLCVGMGFLESKEKLLPGRTYEANQLLKMMLD